MKTYKAAYKLSDRLNGLLPEHVREDSPEFVAFLDAYFDFLESDILILENQTDVQTIGLEDGGSLLQETETSKPTPQDKSKFVIWDGVDGTLGSLAVGNSYHVQPFKHGEYIVGKTSGALGKIKVVNKETIYIDMITDYGYNVGETVLGRESLSEGKVKTYKQNSILANNKLLDYSDIDRTTDEFIQYFQKDFMPSIDFLIEADKKLIIKHIKDLYTTKGTKESLEFLFRVLYKDDAEIIYPIDNTLHVSDSRWDQNNFVQVVMDEAYMQPPSNGKIIQKDANGNIIAEAVIENVFFDPNSEINYKLQISDFHFGEFTIDGDIETVDRTDNIVYYGTIRGVISGADKSIDYSNVFFLENEDGAIRLEDGTLSDGMGGAIINEDSTSTLGSLYTLTDNVVFESGYDDDATDATGQVDGLTDGKVTEVFVEDDGSGYVDGDLIIFDDNGTSGSGALGIIDSAGDHILLEGGTQYGHFEFTATNGQTIFEGLDDNGLVMSFNPDDVRVDVNGVTVTSGFSLNGPAGRVSFTSGRNNGDFIEIFSTANELLAEDESVLQLDSVDGFTSNTGIRKVKIINAGAGYRSLPIANPGGYIYMSNSDLDGFQVGETITNTGGSSAKIVHIDTKLNRLSVQKRSTDTGTFAVGQTITGGQSASTGTITQQNVTAGNGAILLTFSDTIGGVGSLRMTEVGNKYNEPARIKKSSTYPMLITTPSTTPTRDQVITGSSSGATGKIIDYNTQTHVLKFKDLTGFFVQGETITFGSSGECKIARFNPIRAMGKNVGEAIEDGNFANDYGYLNSSAMNIFDSRYYQTHSYVVKVGESINKWRSIVKNLIHPAGHIFFGEVAIRTNVEAVADIYNRNFDGTETSRAFIPTLIIGSKVDAVDLMWEDETWAVPDEAISNYYPIELEDTLDGKLKAERYIQEGNTLIDQITGQGYVVGTEIVEDDDNFVSRILEVQTRIYASKEYVVILDTPANEVNTPLCILDEAGVPSVSTDPRTGGSISSTVYDPVNVSNPAGAKSGAFTEIGDSSHRNRHLNLFVINSFATAVSQTGTRQEGGIAGNLAVTSLSLDFDDRDYLVRNDIPNGSFRPARSGKVFPVENVNEEFIIMEDGSRFVQEPVENFLLQEPNSNETQMEHVNDMTAFGNQTANEDMGDNLIFETSTVNLDGDNIGGESMILEDATVNIRDEYFITERSQIGSAFESIARNGPSFRSINIISNQRSYDIAYYLMQEDGSAEDSGSHGDNILLEAEGGSLMTEESNSEGLRINDLNTLYSSFLVPDWETKANRKGNLTFSTYVNSA